MHTVKIFLVLLCVALSTHIHARPEGIRKKFVIVHASTGNGHKTAAQAIADGLRARGAQKVILRDFCDFGPVHHAYNTSFTTVSREAPNFFQSLYTIGDMSYCAPILQALHHISHTLFDITFVDPMIRFLLEEEPDVIIATQPNVAALCSQAKRDGWITQPLVVVVTDLEGHHLWVNKGTDYYWVMNDDTKKSLVVRGAPERDIRVGGIPVRSVFDISKDRNELLEGWGIDPDRLILLFSHWSAQPDYAVRLLKTLEPYGDKVACLMVCGSNMAMKSTLEAESFSFPVKVMGFVDYMPDLMDASDLLIGKVGGLTVTESLIKQIPLVITLPVFGPEQGNAEFLKNNGVAFSIEKPEEIAGIITAILQDPFVLLSKKARLQQLARPQATKDFVNFVLQRLA